MRPSVASVKSRLAVAAIREILAEAGVEVEKPAQKFSRIPEDRKNASIWIQKSDAT
jgi:hypothetical protein